MVNNLYFPVFKNLEKELLSLADNIHFDDVTGNQLSVYSVKIAELLIRTVVEIESISKDLYYKNGGTDILNEDGTKRTLYFDSDCLNFLESKWHLSKRTVLISAPNFYFIKEENKVLTPLYQSNIRGKCDWKKAYQSVKHDRTNNLKKANIKNLIRAMAALYLLNLYYNDESNIIENELLSSKAFGSNVFSIKVENFLDIGGDTNDKTGLDFPLSTYILKYSNSKYKEIMELNKKSVERIMKELTSTVAYKEYIDSGNLLEGENINAVVMNVGSWYFEKKVRAMITFDEQKNFIDRNVYYQQMLSHNPNSKKEITPDNVINIARNVGQTEFMHKIVIPNIRGFMNLFTNSKYELVINKGEKIYNDEI